MFTKAHLLVLATLCIPSACPGPKPPPSPAPELKLTSTNVFPKAWGVTYSATLDSKILGGTRKIRLYLPASYGDTTRKYPVLYFFDGEYYFDEASLAVRQLEAVGHMPECIVAAIENPARRQDLTPPGMDSSTSDGLEPRGEKLLQFITTELRPELESKLRAGGPSVLIGHSHGGILCHYAAAKWRKDFPFILSLDAPVHLADNFLANSLIASEPAKGNLRLISLEVRFGWPDEEWKRLASTAPSEWKLVRERLKGEDHESMVFTGFYEGLKEMFSDYSLSQVRGLRGEEALAHYDTLEPLYGFEVIPPQVVLDRAIMSLAALGKGERARRALNQLADGYGKPDDYATQLAEINEAEAAMKGQETVDQLLALPAPTAEQMKPYLGTWTGSQWIDIDGSQKNELKVTFAVKDGRGVATMENPGAPPEYRISVCKYLRVTKEGIEFGNLNGMFPPGVVAEVATLKDGVLSGESIFKGVYFKYPPDMTPPRHLFSLKRAESPR
jgi:hypothetical protein